MCLSKKNNFQGYHFLSQENTTENYAQRDNFKMTMIAVWFFILLNVSNGFTTYQNESLPLGLVQELHLRPNMTVRLTLNSTQNPLDINDKFWSFEAHSFSSNDHLSLSKTERPKGYVRSMYCTFVKSVLEKIRLVFS